jgi:hypothetical protein
MSTKRLLQSFQQIRTYAAKTKRQKQGESTTIVKHLKGKHPKVERVSDVQLEGLKFDMAVLDGNMQHSIERLRVNLNGVVSRVGRVSAGSTSRLFRASSEASLTALHQPYWIP